MINKDKHSPEELTFLMELGVELSAARVKKGISIARMAKYLKTSEAAISNLEYGFRRTTAWDLRAYAELCDADIGDIFVKVAGVPSKDRDKNYEMMDEEDRELIDQLKKSLAEKAKLKNTHTDRKS